MIHIIGTSHSLQVWSDLRRANTEEATRIRAFEAYIALAVTAVRAEAIAEESSADFVACHVGGTSVALGVAERMGLQHVYCEPDRSERLARGLRFGGDLLVHARAIAQSTGENEDDVWKREVRAQFQAREAFWIERLELHGCASIHVIFVCGADHAESFAASLRAAGIAASIYCPDWTEL